ncbi:MAG: chaperone NapD [Proteobacteria bacterium]|nr:chaperone NapD [Pseudomonadota bacterium]
MTILGVIVRCRPQTAAAVGQRLRELPGVELAPCADAADDGRWVAVIEDHAAGAAAATLGAIALWPEVLNTSLVYEYSGPDSPPPESEELQGYRDWRRSLVPGSSGT